MMHSVVFGDGTLYPHGSADHKEGQFRPVIADTYKDWFLIPSSRPTVSSPGTDSKFVTLPGRDGDWDLSDWLRIERPAFRNRTGSFEFYVENDHEFWMTIFPKIYNSLHGRKFKMVLEEDDPSYYYEGRFSVSEVSSGSSHSGVKIEYNLQPWKRRVRKALDGMCWDIFNFELDYDYDPWGLGSLVVSGSETIDIWGDGYPWQPEVSVISGGSVTVTLNGKTATVSGSSITNGVMGRAKYGPNQIVVSGNATVSINWRGGSL